VRRRKVSSVRTTNFITGVFTSPMPWSADHSIGHSSIPASHAASSSKPVSRARRRNASPAARVASQPELHGRWGTARAPSHRRRMFADGGPSTSMVPVAGDAPPAIAHVGSIWPLSTHTR
jgi:hypothetical protein